MDDFQTFIIIICILFFVIVVAVSTITYQCAARGRSSEATDIVRIMMGRVNVGASASTPATTPAQNQTNVSQNKKDI